MGLGIPDISIGKGMAVSYVEGQIAIMENTTQKSLLAGNQSQMIPFHLSLGQENGSGLERKNVTGYDAKISKVFNNTPDRKKNKEEDTKERNIQGSKKNKGKTRPQGKSMFQRFIQANSHNENNEATHKGGHMPLGSA